MAHRIRSLAAALCVAGLAPLEIVAEPQAAFAQTQQPGAPAELIKQIPLADAQVRNFLAAQSEIAPILAKQPENASDKPDPKLMAQLDAVAKKHNFASYDDFDEVEGNIGLVVDGIDPETKKYVGADVVLKKQIAQIQADKKIPAADKKQALEEMNGALKSIEPIKFPANIDLVLKNYDKIIATMPPSQDN